MVVTIVIAVDVISICMMVINCTHMIEHDLVTLQAGCIAHASNASLPYNRLLHTVVLVVVMLFLTCGTTGIINEYILAQIHHLATLMNLCYEILGEIVEQHRITLE